jgi:hypothetical protein
MDDGLCFDSRSPSCCGVDVSGASAETQVEVRFCRTLTYNDSPL